MRDIEQLIAVAESYERDYQKGYRYYLRVLRDIARAFPDTQSEWDSLAWVQLRKDVQLPRDEPYMQGARKARSVIKKATQERDA